MPDSPVLPMATAAVPNPVPSPPLQANANLANAANNGVNKRYRAAPAKTFQCRGYGDCRMVFSRSEHLARHVRKHTGERPFSCHCGKQFSRLDNLRQHAQTVHADKQELNEQMMRELTALHTSMAASHKASTGRGKRANAAAQAAHAASQSPTNLQANGGGHMHNGQNGPSSPVKEEEMQHPLPSNYGQQRPGTSVGYEVGPDQNGSSAGFPGTRTWQLQTTNLDTSAPSRQAIRTTTSPNSANHSTHNHSFRDPSQSFRVPPPTPQQQQQQQQQQLQQQQQQQQQQQYSSGAGQSFLPAPAFSVPNPAPHASSGSRPPTATVPPEPFLQRTLPPFASVVSQSITSSVHQPPVLPLPSPFSGSARRPSTAPRPGTAPASYFPFRPAFGGGGHGMAPVAELPVHGHGRDRELGGAGSGGSGGFGSSSGPLDPSGRGEYPPSPPGSGPNNDSPFSFHPPSLTDPSSGVAAASASSHQWEQQQHAQPPPPSRDDYEYGSDSRPQSRRLSVMELCNEPSSHSDADGSGAGSAAAAATIGSRPFLPLSSAPRPGTASGGSGSHDASPLARGRVHAQSGRDEPSAAAAATADFPGAGAATLSGPGGGYGAAAASGGGRASPSSVPRRGAKGSGGGDSPHDQVRVVASPAQSAAAPAGVRV